MAAGTIPTAKCSLLIVCSDAFMHGLCLYLELHNAMLELSHGLYIRGVASIKKLGRSLLLNFTTIQGLGHLLKEILAGTLRLAGVDSSNHRRSLPIAELAVHQGKFL